MNTNAFGVRVRLSRRDGLVSVDAIRRGCSFGTNALCVASIAAETVDSLSQKRSRSLRLTKARFSTSLSLLITIVSEC